MTNHTAYPVFGYLVIDGVAQSDEPELITKQQVVDLLSAGHTITIY